MFTGLVEEKGTLVTRTPRGVGARVTIGCAMSPLVLGESIAVDGVCLTVDKILPEGFEADCSKETLARTTLGSVRLGGPVNLERATPLGGRMGGHIVSGHVDGTGTVAEKKPVSGMLEVLFTLPRDLARYVAEKGSICVNGVSLTVNSVSDDAPNGASRFGVTLVPHTIEKTSLQGLEVGAHVNLEVDVLARYVARLHDVPRSVNSADDVANVANADADLLEKLQRNGFM